MIKENTFDVSDDANIAHTENHVSVNSVNVYDFMGYSYKGDGPYRNGSFLVPHSREMFYKSRKELAFYKNYVKPIIDATYAPVFANDVQRTVDPETSIFWNFLRDVDNSGTGMQSFIKNAIRLARLHGVSFVVMDNKPATAMPMTMGAVRESRAFPYVYVQKAQKVDDYLADRFGNIEWISFIDGKIKESDGSITNIYRIWTRSSQHTAKKRKNSDGTVVNTSHDINKYSFTGTIDHGLGVVPVIPVWSARPDDPEDIMPEPPFYDVARINHAIYNKDSEIRDLERAQGFSVLTIQNDNSSNLTLGSHNVLWYPIDSTNPPSFIAPDPAIMTGLVENGEKLRDDLFRIAEQLGVVGVKSEQSGVALGYRFFGQEAVLKASGLLANNTEHKIADLFRAYTGIDFGYNVEYPEDYQPIDLGGEGDRLDKYLMQDLTRKAKVLALQKYTRLMLGDQDTDRLQDVLQSFEDEAADIDSANQISESDNNEGN